MTTSRKINHVEEIDKTAIAPFDTYCDGYGCPGAVGNGYVSVLKVSAGKVVKSDDRLLDGIVAYDRAECNDAYVGQINMITASSFNGLAGQVWGYDLAVHDDIANDKVQPVLEVAQYDDSVLPIYDAKPLQDAGLELFGSEKERRFHLLPGAHTICATKDITAFRPFGNELKEGQAYGVWSFIAISFARDRAHGANLFIEDAGIWTKDDNPESLKKFLEEHRANVAGSIVACGKDSNVLFDRTFIGFAYEIMQPGEIGTALTCAPYVSLARQAVPARGFKSLNTMKLSQWLEEMKFESLSKLNK